MHVMTGNDIRVYCSVGPMGIVYVFRSFSGSTPHASLSSYPSLSFSYCMGWKAISSAVCPIAFYY
jgi:hypothetical protein